jgi:biotin carboxylase
VIPGYGFLSENADFAAAVEAMCLNFIGPTPEQMRDLGLKYCSRETALDGEIPVIPGRDGLAGLEDAIKEAEKIGYTVMVKNTAWRRWN